MAVETFTTPGTSNWTVPVGVTSVQVETWSAGGAGGNDNGVVGGGGGGGGGYTIGTLATTPGSTYTNAIIVGAAGTTTATDGNAGGDSTFVIDGSHYVSALGGSGGLHGGNGGSGGLGGVNAGATSVTGYNGGNGANPTISGGGGGSSAGTGSNGNNGSGSTGGAAVTGGGAGGDSGASGSAPGGGGGGADNGGAPGAGADGKVVLTYTPDPDNAGFRKPIIVETPSPPPFPGLVIALKNPYGDPPPSFASGPMLQKMVSTPSPPPFDGQAIGIRGAMGETPAPASPTRSYRPIPDMDPPFPGAVLTALSAPFGLSAIPARPVKVETAIPEPFGGRVIANRPTFEPVRESLVPAAIARTEEPAPTIAQPAFWSGTHERPSTNPIPAVIRHEEPPLYAGGVIAARPGFGLSAVPPPRAAVVRGEAWEGEPGRVLVNGASEEPAQSLVTMPRLVRMPEEVREVVQPTYWVGVPAREAPHKTAAIVRQVEESPFPGRVQFLSNPFGIFPTPSRPVVIRETEGYRSATEPGRVVFASKTPTDPVDLPRVAVVREVPGYPSEPGRVLSFGGYAAPTVVAPSPKIVAGDTRYPEVGQPFFGWGWRTGTGEPSGVPPGNPVSIIGYDNSAVSLTSEDCECL